MVKKDLPEVITVRTWKEYVEESLLIIFSVVLALFLTELFRQLHENEQMREVMHELREELISNKKAEEIQLQYHLQVIRILIRPWPIRPSRSNLLIKACLI